MTKLIKVLVLTAALTALFSTTANAETVSGSPDELATQCGSVDTSSASDNITGEDIDALTAAGFWAPYDYQEVLYSPACEKDSATQAYERGQQALDDPSADSNNLCYSDNVGENSGATDEIIAELVGAGFFSNPNDGAERLYSPGCHATPSVEKLVEPKTTPNAPVSAPVSKSSQSSAGSCYTKAEDGSTVWACDPKDNPNASPGFVVLGITRDKQNCGAYADSDAKASRLMSQGQAHGVNVARVSATRSLKAKVSTLAPC
jgi:hypothetical protein